MLSRHLNKKEKVGTRYVLLTIRTFEGPLERFIERTWKLVYNEQVLNKPEGDKS